MTLTFEDLAKRGLVKTDPDTIKNGTKPKQAGIYQCQSCGYEDVINRECEKMPPCASCKNNSEWRLQFDAKDTWRKK